MITTLGKRGPTPAPTAIRRLHRARPDRINNAEPVPNLGPVVPPSWLSPTCEPSGTSWPRICSGAGTHAVGRRDLQARAAMPPPVALSSIWRPRARLWSKPSWSSCAHLGHRGRLVGWSAACRCGWRVTRRTPALRDQEVDAHELCSNETDKRNEGNYESVAT